MSELLDGRNQCGQTLLRLVSRGNAIIAEILRLSDMVPSVFRLDSKNDNSRYGQIICDFTYFKTPDFEADFNKKLDLNPSLQDKDDEFRENFMDILSRFYLMFESIHTYSHDLKQFLEDVEGDVYIQQSLESLLINRDGKQLLCEALFLLGVMLLLVDKCIEGVIRERMLVSYYRYSAQKSSSDSNIDDVCNMFRTTGYSLTGKRPVGYPEEYLKRARINPAFVSMAIGRLRSDDIYNQSSAYPLPEHRSVALSGQASILYVVLFFAPDILHNQPAIMREIVDRFFPDNWIISIHMGLVVNLIDSWETYRSAKQALSNTLELNNIKENTFRHSSQVCSLQADVKQLLRDGYLTPQLLLEKTNSIMNTIRNCNVTLRWLMLHISTSSCNENMSKGTKRIRDAVKLECQTEPLDIFRLLLMTSELELRVKEIYQKLLQKKEENWTNFKNESHERILELAEVFSGQKPLSRVSKNLKLEKWFRDIGAQIDQLTFDASNPSTKKTVLLIQALEEAQEFHQLDSVIQVKEYLTDIKKLLHWMLKTLNVRDEVLITLQIIGDLAYAWQIIDDYTVYMQKGIKNDPTLVIKLRATFLKLASALDIPLLRINQSGSPDLVTVSQFFSSELVSYVRKVLHIIPETMFGLMAKIIELQTTQIKELPTRLMKDQLNQYAQVEHRSQVAHLTHSISVFTEGLLMMKTTLVGIIQIDPKKLLEDGIRKELVCQVAASLHQTLVFNPKAKPSEISAKLTVLSIIMDGFRRSFEYIQDYVCIYGLKIWQEEVSRIVNFNVEQECNAFMRQKVLEFESVYQSKSIPIPKFEPIDVYSVNFVGRLARELLRITDPKNTIYVHQMGCWYDSKTRHEIVNPRVFSLILKSIGTSGINGLDKLISFMIYSELSNIKKFIEKTILRDKVWQPLLVSISTQSSEDLPEEAPSSEILNKMYIPLLEKANKSCAPLNDAIMRVGQMQVVRSSIAQELKTSCKFQSRHLASTLSTVNQVVLSEIQNNKIQPKDDSSFLFELSNYLDWTGISEPMSKVYISPKPISELDVICFVLAASQISKFTYIKSINGISAKRLADSADGFPFVIGLLTLLRQFHENQLSRFLAHSCRYINLMVSSSGNRKNSVPDLPQDVFTFMSFLEEFTTSGNINRSFLSNLPPFLFDDYHYLSGAD